MKKIKSLLKNNGIIYFLYNRIISIFIRFIGLFCPIDNKLVLINSFGGAKFNDSPKAIYDYMINSKKYKDYKIIWALDNPNIIDNCNVKYVKNNSLKFFITALKAQYWITNSSMERGLKFKKKKTIYINTWHGSALKKMGFDTETTTSKFRVSKPDIFYAQSEYDKETFARAFKYNKGIIRIIGLPRNDELCNFSNDDILLIKKKLNIYLNKKVILYAPTFREYNYDINGCFIAPPIDIRKWEKRLSKDYVLLFRAHYEVNKVLNIENSDFIYNVTDYQYLNDLLKISDILISDYSSIMIDYSILERPIFAYTYDYEEYNEKRGLYFDLSKVLPNGIQKTEDDLLNKIINCDFKRQKNLTKIFKNKFVEKSGNASKYIDKIIQEKIGDSK